jgi:hypothetical protein
MGIFSNIEILNGVNVELLREIIRAVATSKGTEIVFGGAFIRMSGFLKVYISFVRNQDISLQTYNNCKKHNSEFANFLQVNLNRNCNEKIFTFLILV